MARKHQRCHSNTPVKITRLEVNGARCTASCSGWLADSFQRQRYQIKTEKWWQLARATVSSSFCWMERLWFWQTPGCTESSWLRLAVQVVTAEQQSRWGDRFSHTQKRTHTCAHKPTLNAAHFLLDCCLFLSAVFCRLPRHVLSVSSTAFLSCRFLNKEKKKYNLEVSHR